MRRRIPISIQFSDALSGDAVGCTIGLLPSIGVTVYGADKADALHKAAGIANDLAGVLQEHPALAAVLPPGTGLALTGLQAASKALADGHGADALASMFGPKTASLASKLLSLF